MKPFGVEARAHALMRPAPPSAPSETRSVSLSVTAAVALARSADAALTAMSVGVGLGGVSAPQPASETRSGTKQASLSIGDPFAPRVAFRGTETAEAANRSS